jgi:glycosyltransferase involved in cell wall biosynthesis
MGEPAAVAGAAAPGSSERRTPLRLLFLLPFPPRLDARHGGARAAAHIVAAHSTRHDVAVLYLRGGEELEIDPALRTACRLVEEVRLPRSAGVLARALHHVGIAARQARGMPYWPASVGGSYVASRIRRLVREWRPDLVRLECLPMGQFADAAAEGRVPVVLAAYDSFAEAASEELASTYRLKRLFAAVQLARWRRYERSIVRRADAIVTFTARDRAVYERAARGETPVAEVALRSPFPPRALDAVGAAPPEVLFAGNFVHPPNVDAALRLVEAVAPLVWTHVPEARVTVVGHDPPALLRARAGGRVTVTGTVPDVEPYLERSAVVAVPLRLGGGMRVKVIEALAAGKAVVATPRALEGLDVRDGVEVRVADDAAAIAAAIVALLRAPEDRVAMGARARAWARGALDPVRWMDEYDALYRRLLGARASQAAAT